MTEIEITDLSDVREGDWVKAEYVGHAFEGCAWVNDDGLLLLGTTVLRYRGGTATAVKFLSASRERPGIPAEPGAVFWATVRGVPDVLLFFIPSEPSGPLTYRSVVRIEGAWWHSEDWIEPDSVRLAKVVEA